jgi:hypothetical protein
MTVITFFNNFEEFKESIESSSYISYSSEIENMRHCIAQEKLFKTLFVSLFIVKNGTNVFYDLQFFNVAPSNRLIFVTPLELFKL